MTVPDPQSARAAESFAGRSVADLVRDVVATAAEDELLFFDDICNAYSKNPQEALDPRARDELSGFAELFLPNHLITPILIEIVAMLAVDAAKRAGQVVAKRRRGARSPVLDAPVTTTAEQQAREAQETLIRLSVQAQIPADVVQRVNVALYIALTGTNPEPPHGSQ